MRERDQFLERPKNDRKLPRRIRKDPNTLSRMLSLGAGERSSRAEIVLLPTVTAAAAVLEREAARYSPLTAAMIALVMS